MATNSSSSEAQKTQLEERVEYIVLRVYNPQKSTPYTLEELDRPHGRSECPRCQASNGGVSPCQKCGGYFKF